MYPYQSLGAFCRRIAIVVLAGFAANASATLYDFKFHANPDALESTQLAANDVFYNVRIDSALLPTYNSTQLKATSNWLNGAISLSMTNGGQTVSFKDAINPAKSSVVTSGYPSGGFIDLSSSGIWFFALEFAPGDTFVDSKHLSYDAYVYGFLFAYQNDPGYIDFKKLWLSGDTSVLSAHVADIPEPLTSTLALFGVSALGFFRRRKVR